MTEGIRLEIDGEDFTAECEEFTFGVPRVVYDEDNGSSMRRFLGPAGFQITLINPTDRARALVDGGRATRTVKIAAAGNSIIHPTHFIEEWTTTDGIRKVFGRLAWDTGRDAKWVDEPQLAEA
ncbi:hypothetical protein SGFS_065850 [Streptomyces graminofaciens]|uniref:Uncharacterized protein n=1 Tax=Streptomyces graminofaciens TaxID=68212 RepID=A0ABM7FFV9_9ACTN|nr:hypothetical protein [Streptomyces graminofaciens]BBC35291.1 hypothetical protein SGFS_065850 [Streptomyces graminofaciens]